MLIHALRRTEPATVELFGVKIPFHPNAQGHCVAEVAHAAAIERLLSIREGYAEYGGDAAESRAEAPPAPEPSPEAPAPAVADPLVLTRGTGEAIDLNAFTARQVREFAAREGVMLPSGNGTPVKELRLLLAKGLKGLGGE